MTPPDRVWKRIQETAHALAAEKSQPSIRHAQAIVAQILRQECFGVPPPDMVATLAKELLRRICEASELPASA